MLARMALKLDLVSESSITYNEKDFEHEPEQVDVDERVGRLFLTCAESAPRAC
jgi:hypothetical protein